MSAVDRPASSFPFSFPPPPVFFSLFSPAVDFYFPTSFFGRACLGMVSRMELSPMKTAIHFPPDSAFPLFPVALVISQLPFFLFAVLHFVPLEELFFKCLAIKFPPEFPEDSGRISLSL